jgi:hypothetical protein
MLRQKPTGKLDGSGGRKSEVGDGAEKPRRPFQTGRVLSFRTRWAAIPNEYAAPRFTRGSTISALSTSCALSAVPAASRVAMRNFVCLSAPFSVAVVAGGVEVVAFFEARSTRLVCFHTGAAQDWSCAAFGAHRIQLGHCFQRPARYYPQSGCSAALPLQTGVCIFGGPVEVRDQGRELLIEVRGVFAIHEGRLHRADRFQVGSAVARST